MLAAQHPLRRRAVEEMHLRRFGRVEPPCQLIQMVRLLEKSDREAEAKRLAGPPDGLNVTQRSSGKYAVGRSAHGVQFYWEGHTEATTLTLIFPEDREPAEFGELVSWLEGWPGLVVRATQIKVFADEKTALEEIGHKGFFEEELVTCTVNGKVRLWSDFRLGNEDYGYLMLAPRSVAPLELGRIIQRIQELGNYRNLALLGLPLVQEQSPLLDELERKLAACADDVASDIGDDELLLEHLSIISAELANISASMGFRLGATRAYANIARDRLDALQVESVDDHQTLADFTDRRLVPAVRTCAVFEDRLTKLSERAAGLSSLLNARIDMRIKAQNRDLLASMERSFGLQLGLQHLVEGISILAASYYSIGLFGYVLSAFGHTLGDGVHAALKGAMVPPVVVAFFILFRRFRLKLERSGTCQRQCPNGEPE